MWRPTTWTFFKDLEDVEHSFRRFAELVPADTGAVVANGDDQNTMETLDGRSVRGSPSAWRRGTSTPPGWSGRTASPALTSSSGGKAAQVGASRCLGEHNVKNAIAAAAAALILGPRRGHRPGPEGLPGAGRPPLWVEGKGGEPPSTTTTPTTPASSRPCWRPPPSWTTNG